MTDATQPTVDWSGVRERVEALADLPAAGKVFGSSGHHFRFDPVLSAEELAELEGQLGVQLPAEYRDFLLTVGRGGAGPSYGVFPLERDKDGRWSWCGDGDSMIDLDRMAEPFPVRHPRMADMRAHDEACPEEENFESSDKYDEAYDEWHERGLELMWDYDRTIGAICLCHLGCAAREWLVVSGPERGHMWSDYRVEDSDMGVITTKAGRPATFADWYLTWLDDATTTATQPPTT